MYQITKMHKERQKRTCIHKISLTKYEKIQVDEKYLFTYVYIYYVSTSAHMCIYVHTYTYKYILYLYITEKDIKTCTPICIHTYINMYMS